MTNAVHITVAQNPAVVAWSVKASVFLIPQNNGLCTWWIESHLELFVNRSEKEILCTEGGMGEQASL